MAKSLGPLDFCCDAPPYVVVQACRNIGIVSPEDVRWCRIGSRAAEAKSWSPLTALRSAVGRAPRLCSCRAQLPPLCRHTFEFNTRRCLCYLMGQCPECRTVYWDEVPNR